MKQKYTYTIDGQYYEEHGYTREELRGLVAHLQGIYPEIVVDIQWRGPVAHQWIDHTGEGLTYLTVEVGQIADLYLQNVTVNSK